MPSVSHPSPHPHPTDRSLPDRSPPDSAPGPLSGAASPLVVGVAATFLAAHPIVAIAVVGAAGLLTAVVVGSAAALLAVLRLADRSAAGARAARRRLGTSDGNAAGVDDRHPA